MLLSFKNNHLSAHGRPRMCLRQSSPLENCEMLSAIPPGDTRRKFPLPQFFSPIPHWYKSVVVRLGTQTGYKGTTMEGIHPGDFSTGGKRWSNRTHTAPPNALTWARKWCFLTHTTRRSSEKHVAKERTNEREVFVRVLPFIPRNKKRRRERKSHVTKSCCCCWVVVRRVSPYWDAALGAINAHNILPRTRKPLLSHRRHRKRRPRTDLEKSV